MCLHFNATAQEVNLGTANNFEVLSAAGITSTGTTLIHGNVGTTPITGAAITGLTALQVNGTIYTTDSAGPAGSVMDPGLLTTAMGAVTTAYNQALGLASSGALPGTIGTLTLTPGVYTFSSSALLTGMLTLNDEGLKDPVFVFQIGSSLTTATGSSVVEENLGPGTIPGPVFFGRSAVRPHSEQARPSTGTSWPTPPSRRIPAQGTWMGDCWPWGRGELVALLP